MTQRSFLEPQATLVLSQPCRACAQRHAVAVELGDERHGYYLAEQRRLQCEQRAGWYWRG